MQRLNDSRSNALLFAGFFLFLLAWSARSPMAASAQGPGGPASVVVATVTTRDLSAEKAFVANVNPWRQVTIGSAVDGRVLDFLVKAGEAVEQSQPLAQLRTKTIEIEIAGAEAELVLRQAELDELRNGSRADEIALAEALTEVARANNAYAMAKLDRAKRLFRESTGISQDEYEAAEAESLVGAAKVKEVQSSLRLVKEGPRQEKIDQAAANVEIQKQILEGLRDRKEKYTLRAPFDGFVSAELSEKGAWVKQGDAVAEVVEIDPIEIEVFVPETGIRFVKLGGAVNVAVEAIPDQPFVGTIERIVPLADSRSRTFPVRVRVANQKVEGRHPLLPGMLARVTLPAGTLEPRTLVPKDALQLSGSNAVVFRVIEKKADIVPVTTGPSLGSWIAVSPVVPGQLNEGDLVITRGNERLRPGQDVKINEHQAALQ
ncbi:efflux RND transporter periplasmic adaptor subunit [Novipirellula artificiosorum]|uniref:Cation efflux system protein CusB n=1 Tax=Novipirellula artificiosorum TaxID=2528016 RepID=A0A5C6DXF1_9BACT|nr:efflux RND transporter periplasmic adaptor subunit [Novipirellula artificiosorum]TWU41075.1 Cation efflux system protein CusB precursor [Novipirellula artificiosorum]